MRTKIEVNNLDSNSKPAFSLRDHPYSDDLSVALGFATLYVQYPIQESTCRLHLLLLQNFLSDGPVIIDYYLKPGSEYHQTISNEFNIIVSKNAIFLKAEV